MSNAILVAYASRTGSTAEIAEAIGQTLAENGASITVCPVQEVKDLEPYRAVVVGSAIRGCQWLPEAMQFMRSYRTALSQRPFAAFAVCMTLALKNETWRDNAEVQSWLAPVRALVKPVSEGYFAGILDINQAPSLGDRLQFRVSVALGIWEEGDHRDWDAIRAWAAELKPILES